MTLTEFLTARLDEDEVWAAARWAWTDTHSSDTAVAIRLRKEVAAKRRILERWDELDGNDPAWRVMDDQTAGQRAEWEDTLRDLASVYADHPDYRQEWA